MSHTVFIALGTNLGDRPANLKTALQNLRLAVQNLECSPVYETPPWGYLDQPKFLNQVVKGGTRLSPADLLSFLKNLEVQMGRQQTKRNGPRLIDLDILFYDRLVMETGNLTIPHPQLSSRAFVLKPLADIAPRLRHPVLGLTVNKLLKEVDASGIERVPLPSTC